MKRLNIVPFDSPCHGCTERTITCHSECLRYEIYQEHLYNYNHSKQKQQHELSNYIDYLAYRPNKKS